MQVSFEHIRMAFGANEVLHDVSMTIPSGAIFALLGENGAGKSTLMNLLGGIFQPVSGRILLNGEPVCLASPADAIRQGIGFIHQELCPVNDLAVYENIFLGREKRTAWGGLDREKMRRDARNILEQLGGEIDENAMMGSLDTSRKQMVAIARALLFQAKVLVMDEPTTSLTEHEISRLFALVRRLARENGVTILFISHKLNEIKELCTDYAVLRNGSLVDTGKVAEVSCGELSECIVGRELTAWERPVERRERGTVVMQVCGLTRGRMFQDVSFDVHSGEILGVTGLLGGGYQELARSIFCEEGECSGRLLLDGRPFHARDTAEAVEAGIAYVPGNRKENAIFPDMSVLMNGTLASLPMLSRMGVILRKNQREIFQRNIGPFQLKCEDVEALITSLSGGNQQKVILARWLGRNPRVLILDNPTQGVDIGAKQEIYECIRRIAAGGVAVIVISGEGQEIQRLCHRALVMSRGRIVGELQGGDLCEGNILKLAMGA